MQTIGVISQERLKIEVKLLLSANRKSHMPRRFAKQRITLSDLQWPFVHCALYLGLTALVKFVNRDQIQRARVNTDAEKWNLGQMCHTLVCRRTEPAGSTMSLINTLVGCEIFSAKGV